MHVSYPLTINLSERDDFQMFPMAFHLLNPQSPTYSIFTMLAIETNMH